MQTISAWLSRKEGILTRLVQGRNEQGHFKVLQRNALVELVIGYDTT